MGSCSSYYSSRSRLQTVPTVNNDNHSLQPIKYYYLKRKLPTYNDNNISVIFCIKKKTIFDPFTLLIADSFQYDVRLLELVHWRVYICSTMFRSNIILNIEQLFLK